MQTVNRARPLSHISPAFFSASFCRKKGHQQQVHIRCQQSGIESKLQLESKFKLEVGGGIVMAGGLNSTLSLFIRKMVSKETTLSKQLSLKCFVYDLRSGCLGLMGRKRAIFLKPNSLSTEQSVANEYLQQHQRQCYSVKNNFIGHLSSSKDRARTMALNVHHAEKIPNNKRKNTGYGTICK